MIYINEDIINIGVKDFEIDLFEGQYPVENGMMYNSYIVLDDKITIFDTVDANFSCEWLDNIEKIIGDKQPEYLIIQHLEPDHSGSLKEFIKKYPKTKIVANTKSFAMINQFFQLDLEIEKIVIKDKDILTTGKHTFNFMFAPMVHWPEVFVTYDEYSKILFSADAFGTFGVYEDNKISLEEWVEEASRYYIGIVSKYGVQVQNLIKKVLAYDIKIICSLHGPILDEKLDKYIEYYNIWSSYENEKDGVLIAYASAYNHTKKAAELLYNTLKEMGKTDVVIYDLARDDISKIISESFRYKNIIIAGITYNAGLFPVMQNYINALVARNFQNKSIGIIENGSWAPVVKKLIIGSFEKCKNINYFENNITLLSSLNDKTKKEINLLAKEICELN